MLPLRISAPAVLAVLAGGRNRSSSNRGQLIARHSPSPISGQPEICQYPFLNLTPCPFANSIQSLARPVRIRK